MSTASLDGARDHARAQAGAAVATQRTIPATAARDLPAAVDPDSVVWDETIAVGNYTSRDLSAGSVMRLSDAAGDACAHLVVYNSINTCERLNVADTVKVQWQAYLGPSAVLLSDMGRALMTIVADTSARHDALCGTTSASTMRERFGASGVHSDTPSVRDLLTVAAAKHGLSRRDLPPGINLFKSVVVDADGSLRLDGAPQPGTYVELRAEMDVLVLLANVPHPLDPRSNYAASTLRVTAWMPDTEPGGPAGPSTPERLRAYENTDDLLRGAGR